MPSGVYKRTKRVGGWKFSKEICRKLSIIRKGHLGWNKGKSYNSGSNHPLWKGGRIYDGQGYIKVWKPTHPFCSKSGYVKEHRLVIEKQIGRYLYKWEISHHINGIRDDNRPNNLKLFPNRSEHHKIHQPKRCGFISKCIICKKPKRIISLKYNCCSNCYHLNYLKARKIIKE